MGQASVKLMLLTALVGVSACNAPTLPDISASNKADQTPGSENQSTPSNSGVPKAAVLPNNEGAPSSEDFVLSVGKDVSTDETGKALGLSPGVTRMGTSVTFAARRELPANVAELVRFQIPLAEAPTDNMVVMYRLAPNGSNPPVLGLIPLSMLEVNTAEGTVIFKPRGLGEYQVGMTAQKVSQEVTSDEPLVPSAPPPPPPPPKLQVLGTIAYTNFYGIDVTGTNVFLIGDTGLRVVSITNPAQPTQIGMLTNANGEFGNGRGIRLGAGNLLIQTTNQGGYGAFNITTPTAPTFRGGVGDNQGRDLVIIGNFAFGATSTGVRLFTYANNITLNNLTTQTGGCTGVDGDTTILVATCNSIVFGLTTNALPNSNAVTIDAAMGGRGVMLANNYAYVVGDDGLRIYDVIAPLQPKKLGTLAIPGALQVAVRGNLAIVLTATSAMLVDVTSKTAPQMIAGSALTITNGRRVKFIAADRALILDGNGLQVVSTR